jgi:hypothetical protein
MSPLRTTGSQLQCVIRNILYNDFFKFNVHSRLQVGYRSAIAKKLPHAPHTPNRSPKTPLRTTGSQLQCVIRNILYNDFFKFNVHSRLQVG